MEYVISIINRFYFERDRSSFKKIVLLIATDILLLVFHGNGQKWLTLVLLKPDKPVFANSVDPDQLASEQAI